MDKNKLSDLLMIAHKARLNAYAPYSNYQVGCAILLENGNIVQGVNVENASYGATICAERSAITAIVTNGFKDQIKAVAVVTESSPPGSPCGLCRQVLGEFMDPEVPIILGNEQGESFITNLKELVPMAFNRRALRK